MSETGPTGSTGSNGAAQASVKKRRGISPIWLIPIVAVAVAASVAYRTFQEQGPKVVILFESGQGLVAGKSVVKFRDVEIGVVDMVSIRDVKHVEVHVSLDKGASKYLTEGAQWWVVRPRVGSAGVSGLGTIISGSFVTFAPGPEDGKRMREFVGLQDPPLPPEDAPGLRIVLHTQHLGGLDIGSPIFFRDIHVGQVTRFALAKDGKHVDVHAVISGLHSDLLKSNSRFWNAGGVEISVGPSGLDVKTETLKSILTGGIAFDSPGGGEPAKTGDGFWLHGSHADAHQTAQTHGGLGLVVEAGGLGGVAPGNAVYYREVPVGAVVSSELSKDGSRVRIRLNIEQRYAALVRSNSVFWNAGGISADLGLTGLHVHAESLKSLLSGGIAFATPPKAGQHVSEGSVFELHPEPKKDWMKWETNYEPEATAAPKEHGIGHFFHHEKKTEEEAKQDDPQPEPTPDEHKHHFIRNLFHRGDAK